MPKLTNQMYLKAFVAAILLTLLSVVSSHAQKRGLSETEAIKLAERFIAQNGYTDLPPEKDKLANESFELAESVEEMLKMRRDTIEPKAYGISSGRKGGSPGWTVVFRYKHPSGQQMRRNGRAVTMNLDGGKMRVEHVDFILKKVDKRL
jgi:cell division protein FtsL